MQHLYCSRKPNYLSRVALPVPPASNEFWSWKPMDLVKLQRHHDITNNGKWNHPNMNLYHLISAWRIVGIQPDKVD